MANLPHIYLIINTVNQKVYVGQTNGNGKSYLGGGKNLEKAQNKYGRKNFTKSVLINFPINVTQSEMDLWEVFYIKLFNSIDRNTGYNIESGGRKGYKRRTHTAEAIEKISIRAQKQDNKIHIRAIQKVAARNKIGVKRTEEEKIKIAMGKYGDNRIIEIYNKDMSLFDTCITSAQASILTGVKRSAISMNLVGSNKSTLKYIFKYKII